MSFSYLYRPLRQPSKRRVLAILSRNGATIGLRRPGCSAPIACRGARPDAQQLYVLGPNLGHIVLYTVLVVIRGIPYAPLNIELVALVYILLYNLGKPPPQNNIMPVCALWHLCSILEHVAALGRSHRKPGHGHPLVNVPYFRFPAHITNKHHLIHDKTESG